jgi:hypothetical protein
MKRKKLLDEKVGRFRLQLEKISNPPEGDHHDFGIPSQAWRRGAKILRELGLDAALLSIDERAKKAAARGDIATARRWRDLIVAIHAMTEDENIFSQPKH